MPIFPWENGAVEDYDSAQLHLLRCVVIAKGPGTM